MYRKKQTDKSINFLYDTGGLGDLIGSLPVHKFVYDKHAHVIQNIWVPDYALDLVRRSLPISKRIIIKPFAEKDKYNTKNAGRAFGIHHHTNLGTHITIQAFNVLVNSVPSVEYLNYLPVFTDDINVSRFSLPENYVVVCTGFTAEVRELFPEYINEITQYLISKNITPVFLGKAQTPNGNGFVIEGNFKKEIDYAKGINLLDKTTLLESVKIIKGAKTIIGLDNGLLHLAGTTEIPIVGSFTTVLPEHRMPYRHNKLGWNYYPLTPPESLACRGCQSNWQFTYNHDFKKCFYGDKKCIEEITPDMYIKELENIL